MNNFTKIGSLLMLLILVSCKELFTPEITAYSKNILVVEGIINIGNDSTIIKLNRTTLVSDQKALKPELGSTVTVESDANETFNLADKGKGIYASPALNLSATKKYRLRIKTAQNTTYLSDFVETKVSPVIDSVNFKITNNGLQLYANTHDLNNKSRYYRWEYIETWIFYAKFNSQLKWNGTELVDRDFINNDIWKCWGNYPSSTIVLGSTAKLEKDVLFQNPLTVIPFDSEKLRERYSILVKQYTLTKEAYDFWESLKKNTETLGSIFDAQPSQLIGNIHNINQAEEPVIGYISAGTVQQKRIFIDKSQLTPAFNPFKPSDCEMIIVEPKNYKSAFAQDYIPVDYSSTPSGVYVATRFCADCTLRGVNKKPPFWQ